MSAPVMNWPHGRRGQWLALGLLALIVMLACAAVAVPAWWAWNRYDRIAREAEDKIDRYRRIALHREEYQRALEAVKAREASRFFLKNTASTQAGAELTDLVRTTIETNGGRLSAIQPATVKDDSGYRLYTLPVGFIATPANMTRILLALETTLPYLWLEGLTLRTTVPRDYKGVPNVEPEVTVNLEVQAYGYKQPARTSATQAASATPSAPAPANAGGRP